MFKVKDWFQACAAGIVFVLAYNLLILHTTICIAIVKSLVVACEANLVLLIYWKIRESLKV